MNTNPLIAACGLDCSTCDARIATLTDDNILRQKTADLWKEAHNADITAEMINCTGCREAGAKIGYCSICEIRNCAIEKNYTTCGECKELKDCSIVRKVHTIVPEALENLLKTN